MESCEMIINGDPVEDSRIDDIDFEQIEPFHNYDRGRVVDSCVLHESAGINPVPRLRANKWGCHLICHPDGRVGQGCDVARACSHAPGMNKRSVGIEIVNPYTGGAQGPWKDTIEAPWCWAPKGKPRVYVVPTLAQLEACAVLVDVLTSACWDGVEIPREWPIHYKYGMPLSRYEDWWGSDGIYPHCHSVRPLRADGPFVALYAYLRLERDHTPEEARKAAMVLASKGHCKMRGGVWVADVGGA